MSQFRAARVVAPDRQPVHRQRVCVNDDERGGVSISRRASGNRARARHCFSSMRVRVCVCRKVAHVEIEKSERNPKVSSPSRRETRWKKKKKNIEMPRSEFSRNQSDVVPSRAMKRICSLRFARYLLSAVPRGRCANKR